MNKKVILIIDDEKTTHIILKAMLSGQFHLIFASSAQEGIDLLGEKPVNLVLLDIQMPNISGMELLESLMIDTELRNVPVIIMTGKATKEIEERARELGAIEFMSKEYLFSEKESAKLKISKLALPKAQVPEKFGGYKEKLRALMKILLNDSLDGDFIKTCRKMGTHFIHTFGIEYISFWTVHRHRVNLIVSLGDAQPENFGPEEAKNEQSFVQLAKRGRPYLTNNPGSKNRGFFGNTSLKKGLNSEIGVPMFKITKEQLLYNNMKIPENTEVFGFVILKRNHVFTTKEYRIISSFILQSSTIFWIMYQRMLKELS